MDRCALFVDASYALSDGALAVHGTRNRDSVSWDYTGLLKLLGSLAADRTGLPLLRSYWYDIAADGSRAAEHDTLADIPGVKVRLSKFRPGRKEGVEAEIRADLTALARNHAVSDVVIVTAAEDLAPVITEIQDLGIRTILLSVAAGGNWAPSRMLRQECDDIVEIGSAHLSPYVDLISGAEPHVAARQQLAPAGPAQLAGPPAAIEAPASQLYAPQVMAEYARAELPQAAGAYGTGSRGSVPGQDAARFADPLAASGASESGRASGSAQPVAKAQYQPAPQPDYDQAQYDQARAGQLASAWDEAGLRQGGFRAPEPSQNLLRQQAQTTGGYTEGGLAEPDHRVGPHNDGAIGQQGSQASAPELNGLPGSPQRASSQSGGTPPGPAAHGLSGSGMASGDLAANGAGVNGLSNGVARGGLEQNGLSQSGVSQSGLSQGGLSQNGLNRDARGENGFGQGGPSEGGPGQGGISQRGAGDGRGTNGLSSGGLAGNGMASGGSPGASQPHSMPVSGLQQDGRQQNGLQRFPAQQPSHPNGLLGGQVSSQGGQSTAAAVAGQQGMPSPGAGQTAGSQHAGGHHAAGQSAAGYQGAGYQGSAQPGGYPAGGPQSGYQTTGYQNAGPQSGYQTGAEPGGYQGGSLPGNALGASDGARSPGQGGGSLSNGPGAGDAGRSSLNLAVGQPAGGTSSGSGLTGAMRGSGQGESAQPGGLRGGPVQSGVPDVVSHGGLHQADNQQTGRSPQGPALSGQPGLLQGIGQPGQAGIPQSGPGQQNGEQPGLTQQGTVQQHRQYPGQPVGAGLPGAGQPASGQPGPQRPSAPPDLASQAQSAAVVPMDAQRQAAPQRPLPAGGGMPYAQDRSAPYGSQLQGPVQQAPVQHAPVQHAPVQSAQFSGSVAPYPSAPYGGQPSPVPASLSVGDAVQAAHAEGFGFGEAVARDAPALWLEAVLARKPRMPSDLEARLLQGSALPIDSLLHDEVRHALRRGFWDALERSRH